MISFGSVLRRGVAAGAAAGLVSALFIWLVVEPVIRKALVIEERRGASGGHAGGHAGESALFTIPASLPTHGGELVTRTQQVIGGAVTSVLVGIAFGVIFAVVFAKARHRLAGATDFWRSLGLATIGFGALTLLPAIVIPANPPAVGDPETVGQRTWLYVLALLLGVAIALAVPMLDRALARRGLTDSTRWSLDVVAALLAIITVVVVLPGTPDVVPDDVPADLLWEFRVASLGQLAAMWVTLGTVFGLLIERAVAAQRDSDGSASGQTPGRDVAAAGSPASA
ncbi:membrane protein [Knoellia sinensis KCTC 19936]|uniref:Membrane protein n=1 Tax=Knoellia sinensis KCTC 19936 TaxID=1385520 RepID=A0A0A0IZS6_9MICO|nr:CbtA family protein [Knoellia sinensis]KGN29964.1 membrane protein [Knoellia sinensis KCTC 19936]